MTSSNVVRSMRSSMLVEIGGELSRSSIVLAMDERSMKSSLRLYVTSISSSSDEIQGEYLIADTLE